jgi:hypothetical protein
MDIKNPTLLKVKGLLFLVLGGLAAAGLLVPNLSWTNALLLALCIWSFCRCYYFAFYVLHHYADPSFNYAGLGSLIRLLMKRKG